MPFANNSGRPRRPRACDPSRHGWLGAAEINLEELRDSLQSKIDQQISIWVHLARVAALNTFGTEKETEAAMEQTFLFLKSNCDEAPDNFAHGVTQ